MSDKNVSDMTDDEIRAMAGASDPVAAYLTKVRQDIDRLGVLYDAGYAVSAQEWGTSMQACADDVPRLLAAVEAVLELHVKMDKPARYYEHCPVHAFDPETRSFGSFETVRTCPDCTYREVWLCKHCECPNDEWPCPTYQAISAGLSGKEDDRG